MKQRVDMFPGAKLKAFWGCGGTGCRKIPTGALLMTVMVAATLLVGRASGQDIFVMQAGVPYPDGSALHPYQIVEQAIFKAQFMPFPTIWISPGEYYEKFTVATPCILKSTMGSVFIGDVDYQASTTLDILTLNTCLFGEALAVNWKDSERATDIGFTLATLCPRPDVVSLQEVWDESLLVYSIQPLSGYTYSCYGGASDCRSSLSLNSGLALLSSHGLVNFTQVCWDDCGGTQCASAKGYVKAVFSKDGFPIMVINLHTQAYPKAEDVAVRQMQMAQLRTELGQLRTANPSSAVFVMGDFNIMGETSEYWETLNRLLGFGSLGVPSFIGIGAKDAYSGGPATYSKSNPLALYMADHWASEDNYPFPPNDQRLDYIFCLPSLDGSVGVVPTNVEVFPFRGQELTEDGLTTNEKSDHWSVRGQFRLVLK